MTLPALVRAREQLLACDLIAHEVRFTQVLSVRPRRVCTAGSESGRGLMQPGEILHGAIGLALPTKKGACHEGSSLG